ncbi:MAG: bifunctional 5,10-methylenetetrahydrofolate dehydrogenase/5,10-methenyltetrahydrofolate cyclohydrolase [Alphaproteobacteria bacterium]|nr:MAG: bifunctional 5,10-methylenetetrahydrofolate dehydrogenase/5,10-methenyltetrahydrofolate cyclohydrolase [Alphaproteobacteria bacterium]
MIIDGKKIAQQYFQVLKENIKGTPGLAAILVGDNPASKVYVDQKRKKAQEIGIAFQCVELPKTATEVELLKTIDNLNSNTDVHGIILQLPLPHPLRAEKFLEKIAPEKDVDGLHPYNLGSLFQPHIRFAPCTPQGCVQLIKTVIHDLTGQKALIIGRSNLVGKPLAHLLLRQNATIQIAHSKSKNLKKLCHDSDIIVAAMGVPELIDDTYVHDKHTIIDVGITKVGGRLYGDVHFDKVEPIVKHITPVPGGVGPMTVFNLMLNTVMAYMRHKNIHLPHTLSILTQTH